MNIALTKYTIEPNAIPLGTVGSYGIETLTFGFDDTWAGLTVEVNFYPAGSSTAIPVVLVDDECAVPAEVTAVAGVGKLVVRGLADGVCINTVTALLTVDETAANPEPTPVTPSEMDQVLGILNETKGIAQSVRDDADNGVFDGTSVTNVEVNASGHLIVTLSSGSTIDAGYVVGSQGEQGVSVTNVQMNAEKHIIVTLSNGSVIDAGAIEGFVTEAELANAVKQIAYDGVDPDAAIYLGEGAAKNASANSATYKAGSTFEHILVPLAGLQDLYIKVKSTSASGSNVALCTDDPSNTYTEGATISYVVRDNNIVVGYDWTGTKYLQYWTQAKFAWINTKYNGAAVAFDSILCTLLDGTKIELVTASGIDVYALGPYTIGKRISALEKEDFVFNIENNALRRYRNDIDYLNDPSCQYSVASEAPYGYYFAINGSSFAYKTCRPAVFLLEWDAVAGAVDYVITVGDKKLVTVSTFAEIDNLIPGKKYKYEVAAISGNYTKTIIKSGTINTEGQIRMIRAEDVFNIRDLGGWQTKFGKKVEYGKIFRGAAFDDTGKSVITPEGAEEIMRNGVTVEIDLRGDVGPDYDIIYLEKRLHTPIQAYEAGLSDGGKIYAALKAVMDTIAQGKGCYLHCRQGADRAGTLAFIIEALLGVSVIDASVDYELSSFNNYQDLAASACLTPRNGTNFVNMLTYIDTFAGDDFNEKVENYFFSIGGTQEEIEAFRAAMLGKEYSVQPEPYIIHLQATSETTGVSQESSDDISAAVLAGKTIHIYATMGTVDYVLQNAVASFDRNSDMFSISAYGVMEPGSVLLNAYLPFNESTNWTLASYQLTSV